MQFNPDMSEEEAKRRANELYKSTKGFRYTEKIAPPPAPKTEEKSSSSSNDSAASSAGVVQKQQQDLDNGAQPVQVKRVWKNGSESEMFNKLEEIARSEHPCTPVLGARITSTLEPENVNDDVCLINIIN